MADAHRERDKVKGLLSGFLLAPVGSDSYAPQIKKLLSAAATRIVASMDKKQRCLMADWTH